MDTWQLQDAKNKLSELVEQALNGRPQMITRRGKPAVVITSVEDYTKTHKPEKNFIDFLLSMPKLADDDEDPFPRIDSPMRDVDW